MSTTIRPFLEQDIPFAIEQTNGEGWDTTAEVLWALVQHDPNGCFVAENGGTRVGMVTSTLFEEHGWIGNLIVSSEFRRHGLGQRLMTTVMRHLSNKGIRTIRLEADPMGISLYRKLGFVEQFESLRFASTSISPPRSQTSAEMGRSDLAEVGAFDCSVFNDDRHRLLRLMFDIALAAYVVRDDERIVGYAMVTPSKAGVHLGPWMSTDPVVAEQLLGSVMAQFARETIVVGVPEVNTEGVALIRRLGFRPEPSSLRMVFGSPIAEPAADGVFAIANGASG